YAWTQISPATPLGTFSSRTLRNPTWTAPAVSADTTFTLQVTVTDGQGASTTATCQLTVKHLVTNQPPTVSSITVSPSMPVAGDVVTLSITATDPDGDPLTIAWTQPSPAQPGAFGSPSQAMTTWVSPVLSSNAVPFTFEVTVSDGHNPIVDRQFTVSVNT